MFAQYMRYHLQVVSERQSGQSCDHGVTIQVLSKALECTRDLLRRITEGTATLADITAHNTLELNCINIDYELSTLAPLRSITLVVVCVDQCFTNNFVCCVLQKLGDVLYM